MLKEDMPIFIHMLLAAKQQLERKKRIESIIARCF
jgi:hypothetical protein